MVINAFRPFASVLAVILVALTVGGLNAQSAQNDATTEPAGVPYATLLGYETLGSESISLEVRPAVTLPLPGDFAYFGLGYGGSIWGAFRLPDLPALSPGLALGYSFHAIPAQTWMQLVSISPGVNLRFGRGPRFSVNGRLSVGYYHGFLGATELTPTANGGGIVASVSAIPSYWIAPQIEIGAEVALTAYLGLLTELGVGFYASLGLPSPESSRLSIDVVDLPDLFPTLHQHYALSPPGSLRITNHARFPTSVHEISVMIPGAMSEPHFVTLPGEIPPGATLEYPLETPLSPAVLDLPDRTTAPVEVTISYQLFGGSYGSRATTSAIIRSPNSIVWDDDRKAAAFVAHRDPRLINRIANAIAETAGTEYAAVERNLRVAIAAYALLVENQMAYVKDPMSPYTEAMREQLIEDFVKFPLQTVADRAGDCDDLSVLYAALLESVGVPAAFITIPGHIYTAFSLGFSVAEASGFIWDADSLIDVDGQAWVPIEVTVLSDGFVEAWRVGADQWRVHEPSGSASVVNIQQAWHEYPPVARPPGQNPPPPDLGRVSAIYSATMDRLVAEQLAPQVETLRKRIEDDDQNVRLRNRLATLFARYGLLDQAAREFTSLLKIEQYRPALINLANVRYLQSQYGEAKRLYEAALEEDRTDPTALLGLARVAVATNDPGAAGLADELERIEPGYAAGFEIAAVAEDTGGRGSETNRRVPWVEE